MDMQVDTDRLERALTALEEAQSDFTPEEQGLFAALMREGLSETLPAEMVEEAQAGSDGGVPSSKPVSDESAERVAQAIMAVRDAGDDEDKKLIDSIVIKAAAPEDGADVQGHYWTLEWDIGAPTNSTVYSFYRSYCNRTAGYTGYQGYLQANFGTFWTHYRCWSWH